MNNEYLSRGKLPGYVFVHDEALDICSVYFYEDYDNDIRRHVTDFASLTEARDFCSLLNFVSDHIFFIKSIFNEVRDEIFNN